MTAVWQVGTGFKTSLSCTLKVGLPADLWGREDDTY